MITIYATDLFVLALALFFMAFGIAAARDARARLVGHRRSLGDAVPSIALALILLGLGGAAAMVTLAAIVS